MMIFIKLIKVILYKMMKKLVIIFYIIVKHIYIINMKYQKYFDLI